MNKVRIIEVIGSLKIGGAEKIAADISSYIDKDRYCVDYLVYDDVESDYTKQVTDNGSTIHRIKMPTSNPIKMYKILKSFFINNKYDVVHAHMMFHNAVVLYAAKKAGVKCLISHAHSANNGKDKKSLLISTYTFFMKRFLNSKIIKRVACSEKAGLCLYGKKYLKDGIFFTNRINSNNYSFDKDKRESMRMKLGVNSQCEMFLIVGHLVPLKNHNLAFEAFSAFHKTNNNSLLFVLGDGYLKEDLISKAKDLGLEDSIVFTGNVSNVNEYMNCADHLLMPSWYEGFPVTLVEAQSLGLHCIVSDTITKEIELTNLISWCSINDLDSWISSMNYKYERRSCNEIIVEKGFDFSTYSKWLNSFYENLIND